MNDYELQIELVKKILSKYDSYEWTLQGFGMLRLYMENGLRMTIWSRKHRVPQVSMIHTHPWNFKSLVIAGRMTNHVYIERGPNDEYMQYFKQHIKAGEGGGLDGTPELITLEKREVEVVQPGHFYDQEYSQLHHSDPIDGTITLCHRKVPEGNDPDYAFVYWPEGYEWVSAEPRPATESEVAAIVNMAESELAKLNLA